MESTDLDDLLDAADNAPVAVPKPPVRRITDVDLNALAAAVHVANRKWWYDLHDQTKRLDRNVDELLMLDVSEAGEALEGERKSLMDDKVPTRPMAEVEVADILIRTLDFAGGMKVGLRIDVVGAKMTDNRAQSLLRIVKSICRVSDLYEENSRDQVAISEALSKVVVNCFSYCEKFGYDLMGAYDDKMKVNATRKDHSVEERMKANGKKF